MKSIIREIREQPLHIRKLFMWSLVIVSFSALGFVWFQGTRQNVLALMGNLPDKAQVEHKDNVASPFAVIFNSVSSLRADLAGLFSGDSKASKEARQQPSQSPIPPRSLPVQ